VAQDDQRIAARLGVFVGGEEAAHDWFDAEDIEVIRGDHEGVDLFGLGVAAPIERQREIGGGTEVREDGVAFAVVLEMGSEVGSESGCGGGVDSTRVQREQFDEARSSSTGSGWRKTALMMVKMAVLAPMPRPSERTAITVKPGRFSRLRRPPRRFCRKFSSMSHPLILAPKW